MNSKWNGCTSILEKFTGIHQSSLVKLQETADNIAFQLPTEHIRVSYFIDNIQNNDPDLRASISCTRINMNGVWDNFETTVAFILPVDPYLNQSNNSNNNAQIVDVNLKGKFQSKAGVYIFWYKRD